MIDFALPVVAFLTTLVSALGDTRRKTDEGLRGITKLGWLLLALALFVLALSATKALLSVRAQAEDAEAKLIAKRGAHLEVSAALQNLSSAMPHFTYIPPLTTRPITQEDIQRGELPLRLGTPTQEEVDGARVRWIQSTKISEFSEEIEIAAKRLQEAATFFLPYLPDKLVPRINDILQHGAVKTLTNKAADKDRTLERAMYDDRESREFQQAVKSLYCELRTDPKIFQFPVSESLSPKDRWCTGSR